MTQVTSCPSADARPGAVLLGVVLPGPELAYMTTRIRVDAEFLRLARLGSRPPEQRFRFSVPCAGGACRQWDGNGCGLVHRVIATYPTAGAGVEECPIRSDCRWFAQRGSEACAVCPGVVTDSTSGLPDELPPRVARTRSEA